MSFASEVCTNDSYRSHSREIVLIPFPPIPSPTNYFYFHSDRHLYSLPFPFNVIRYVQQLLYVIFPSKATEDELLNDYRTAWP